MKNFIILLTIAILCHGYEIHAGSLTGSGVIELYQLKKATYKGSESRDYKVYVPRGYDRTKPVPMVFALHGCAMDHNDVIDNWNWDLVADEHNIIVVFPFITRYEYLPMRGQNCWGYFIPGHIHKGAGEVADLHRMAMEVETNYNIDPERRYIIGLSSGGGMAVASAIAYNDYWAAGASSAGLPYGDKAESVTSENFLELRDYITAIQAELNNGRVIPFMVINSTNDEVVRIKAAELIRDSHMSVFKGNKNSATIQDCAAEGIDCTHTKYTNDSGKTVVETVIYKGAVSGTQCASYGCGHYYGGEDDDPTAWVFGTGPSTTRIAWDFFSQQTLSGKIKPEITAQSMVTEENKIKITGSASDPDGTIVSVNVILKKRTGSAYQDFMVVPVSGDLNSFTAISQPLDDGIYKVYAVATDNSNAQAESESTIQFINVVANPPEIADIVATPDKDSVIIAGKVIDKDNDLERLIITIETETILANIDQNTFSARINNLKAGNHSAEIVAYDSLEQAGTGSIQFSIEYIPPVSVTSTLQKHCEAKRIPWPEYSHYYLKYGLNEFTLYQKVDGTWIDQIPEGRCVTASIEEHIHQGRAYPKTSKWLFFTDTTYYAKGTNESLGDSSELSISLRESESGRWEMIDSCQ